MHAIIFFIYFYFWPLCIFNIRHPIILTQELLVLTYCIRCHRHDSLSLWRHFIQSRAPNLNHHSWMPNLKPDRNPTQTLMVTLSLNTQKVLQTYEDHSKCPQDRCCVDILSPQWQKYVHVCVYILLFNSTSTQAKRPTVLVQVHFRFNRVVNNLTQIYRSCVCSGPMLEPRTQQDRPRGGVTHSEPSKAWKRCTSQLWS